MPIIRLVSWATSHTEGISIDSILVSSPGPTQFLFSEVTLGLGEHALLCSAAYEIIISRFNIPSIFHKAEPLRCLLLNDLYMKGYKNKQCLSEAILAAKDISNYAYHIAVLQLGFEFRWCSLGLKGSLVSGI